MTNRNFAMSKNTTQIHLSMRDALSHNAREYLDLAGDEVLALIAVLWESNPALARALEREFTLFVETKASEFNCIFEGTYRENLPRITESATTSNHS